MYKVLKSVLAAATCCVIILSAGLAGEAPAAVLRQQDAGAEDGSTALLLQITPADGGTLNVAPGVHMYDRDAEVTLKASPKAGYQFVCWQGNVNDSASSNTLVFLDSPKIVVAVFARSKFELMEFVEEESQESGGGGRLIGSPGDIRAPLEQAGGGRRPPKWHRPRPKPPEEEDIDDVPVPDDEGQSDVPIPEVPEPATGLYFLFSIFYLRKRIERHFRRIENRHGAQRRARFGK